MERRSFPLGRGLVQRAESPTTIMGILNVTPDSFSDGGRFLGREAALTQARRLIAEGAAVLDVGGESTRPGAAEVSLSEELDRVIPVIEALVSEHGIPLSVDTRRAAVFSEAWKAGASIVNDVSGGEHDRRMLEAVAETEAAIVLMHMRADPQTMDAYARYENPVREVAAELSLRVDAATAAGIPRHRIVLDPGLGFAKTTEHNLALLRDLDALRLGEFPLLVGASRKRFVGELTGREDPEARDLGTAMISGFLASAGVEMVRVHDVAGSRDALRIACALEKPGGRASHSEGAI